MGPPHLPQGLPAAPAWPGGPTLGRAAVLSTSRTALAGGCPAPGPIPRTMDAEILVRHHGIAVGELAAKGPYVAGLVSEVDDVHTVKLTMYIHSRQGQCGK